MSNAVVVTIGAAERLFGRTMRVPVTTTSRVPSLLSGVSRPTSAASFADATGSPIAVEGAASVCAVSVCATCAAASDGITINAAAQHPLASKPRNVIIHNSPCTLPEASGKIDAARLFARSCTALIMG